MGFAEEFVKVMDEAAAEIPANKRVAIAFISAGMSLVGAVGTAAALTKYSVKAIKATKTPTQ